jgi:acetyltransferase-like isoleucine patch superfamily enzyme
MYIPNEYRDTIKSRSWLRKLLRLIIRVFNYIKYAIPRSIARMRGAQIGKRTILSWKVALNCNEKLCVGDDCIINAAYVDNRDRITIQDNVIINSGVEILRLSHYIDNTSVHPTRFYGELTICSYSWIATGAKIFPSVKNIKAGSIVGAYSVLVSSTEEDGVYSGNPAIKIRTHNSRFSELVVTSQMGGDLIHYYKSL